MLPESSTPTKRHFFLNSFIFGRKGDSILVNDVAAAVQLGRLSSFEDIESVIEDRNGSDWLSADDNDRKFRLKLLRSTYDVLITKRNALENEVEAVKDEIKKYNQKKNENPEHKFPESLKHQQEKLKEHKEEYRKECDKLEESVVFSYIRKMTPVNSVYSFELSKVKRQTGVILQNSKDCEKVASQIERYIKKITGFFETNEFPFSHLTHILSLAIEFDKEPKTPERVRLIVKTLIPNAIFTENIKKTAAEEFKAMDAFLIKLRDQGSRPDFEQDYANIHKVEPGQKAYYEFFRTILDQMSESLLKERVLFICAAYLLNTRPNNKETERIIYEFEELIDEKLEQVLVTQLVTSIVQKMDSLHTTYKPEDIIPVYIFEKNQHSGRYIKR